MASALLPPLDALMGQKLFQNMQGETSGIVFTGNNFNMVKMFSFNNS